MSLMYTYYLPSSGSVIVSEKKCLNLETFNQRNEYRNGKALDGDFLIPHSSDRLRSMLKRHSRNKFNDSIPVYLFENERIAKLCNAPKDRVIKKDALVPEQLKVGGAFNDKLHQRQIHSKESFDLAERLISVGGYGRVDIQSAFYIFVRQNRTLVQNLYRIGDYRNDRPILMDKKGELFLGPFGSVQRLNPNGKTLKDQDFVLHRVR